MTWIFYLFKMCSDNCSEWFCSCLLLYSFCHELLKDNIFSFFKCKFKKKNTSYIFFSYIYIYEKKEKICSFNNHTRQLIGHTFSQLGKSFTFNLECNVVLQNCYEDFMNDNFWRILNSKTHCQFILLLVY